MRRIIAVTCRPVYALGRKAATGYFIPLVSERAEAVPGLLIARTEGRMYVASAPLGGELWDGRLFPVRKEAVAAYDKLVR